MRFVYAFLICSSLLVAPALSQQESEQVSMREALQEKIREQVKKSLDLESRLIAAHATELLGMEESLASKIRVVSKFSIKKYMNGLVDLDGIIRQIESQRVGGAVELNGVEISDGPDQQVSLILNIYIYKSMPKVAFTKGGHVRMATRLNSSIYDPTDTVQWNKLLTVEQQSELKDKLRAQSLSRAIENAGSFLSGELRLAPSQEQQMTTWLSRLADEKIKPATSFSEGVLRFMVVLEPPHEAPEFLESAQKAVYSDLVTDLLGNR